MISNEMAAMEVPSTVPTSVSDFYHGKTVFITGGTGFMGKVLLEKLLRSCPGVAKIYLLIRPRKGQSAQDRLLQLLCSPVSAIFINYLPKLTPPFIISAIRSGTKGASSRSSKSVFDRGRHHTTRIGNQRQRHRDIIENRQRRLSQRGHC